MNRCWLTFALLAMAWAPQRTSSAGGSFDKWPRSWVDTYTRFQGYVTARKSFWPDSGLSLQPDGKISYSLKTPANSDQHLALDVYRRGEEVLGVVLSRDLSLLKGGRETILTPGRYAAYITSTGMLGYQSHSPILRFDVIADPLSTSAPRKRKIAPCHLRAVDPPADPEHFWPNETMQSFLDFHIFGKHHPNDIYKANSRVQPSVALTVTIEGTIRRTALSDPAAEKLLQWRVYRDGELIDKSPAGNELTWGKSHEVGSYLVYLVVAGPKGVMPVSNLVDYPLFPSTPTANSILPGKRDADGVPEFLGPALEAMRTAEGDEPIPLTSENARLLELWRVWGYRLAHPENFTIPLAKEH